MRHLGALPGNLVGEAWWAWWDEVGQLMSSVNPTDNTLYLLLLSLPHLPRIQIQIQIQFHFHFHFHLFIQATVKRPYS